MLTRYLIMAAPLVLIGLCAYFALGNWQPITVNLFGTQQIPCGSFLLLGTVLGILSGLSLSGLKFVQEQGQQSKLAAWETQDIKLAAQVQSDKEKQLEAKISTLETALKAALKKS